MEVMAKRVLLTGGAGFIGHHTIEHIMRTTDWEVVTLDKLSYASRGFDRLRDIEKFTKGRLNVFTVDFSQPIEEGLEKEIGQVDYIVHMGAETHVDNSISNPRP